MLNKQVLISIFHKLLDKAKTSYNEFNSADGKIGDGDLGVTILNGMEEINNNISNFKDDLGDMMVVMLNIMERQGISMEDCLKTAYNDIKDRKGRMIDGIFIKEGDH